MNIWVEPGTWVVAVSGGVDSMTLLHMLHKLQAKHPKSYHFVVAHFDHGIRPDSDIDRKHVQKVAASYKMPFVFEQASLGPKASEAAARKARYAFLHKVKRSTSARGIITAHHQDDALETAIHNLLRGTGRRGLSSLQHSTDLQRPLLAMSKQQLIDCAANHGLVWREDSTNQDTTYIRNYIRHNLLTKFSLGQKAQLAILIDDMRSLNQQIDQDLTNLLHIQPHIQHVERQWFIGLPHNVAREFVHAWLRERGVQKIDRKTIERLVVAIKAAHPGRVFSVDKSWQLHIGRNIVALKPHKASPRGQKAV